MEKHYQVIIVGGGQAGLSVAYCLKQKGISYIIFEKDEIASSWKHKRWDAFCLVTPNFQCRLPGYAYRGNDPEGFMGRDEIVDFVKGYAKSFDANIYEHVPVYEVTKDDADEGYEVETSMGKFTADQVVIAAGNFHSPKFPAIYKKMNPAIQQLHSSEYKSPEQLPEGGVLVVGTGQSGCQVAEDLFMAGKQVHLCVGNAPRSPRRYRGKDVVEWLENMGHYDIPIDEHPDGEKVRRKVNHYLTGRDGGKEIDLRAFAQEGMKLYGLLKDIDGDMLTLGDNLKEDLDKADKSYVGIKKKIDEYIEENNIINAGPVDPPYEPVWEPESVVDSLNLKEENITSVIWCIGWDFDFSWIKLPVLDENGYPNHFRGVTPIDGLYFIGLAWLYTWGSGRFSGIAPDAAYLASKIEEKIGVTHQ